MRDQAPRCTDKHSRTQIGGVPPPSGRPSITSLTGTPHSGCIHKSMRRAVAVVHQPQRTPAPALADLEFTASDPGARRVVGTAAISDDRASQGGGRGDIAAVRAHVCGKFFCDLGDTGGEAPRLDFIDQKARVQAVAIGRAAVLGDAGGGGVGQRRAGVGRVADDQGHTLRTVRGRQGGQAAGPRAAHQRAPADAGAWND